MEKFEITIKEAIKKCNNNLPKSEKKTITSIAEKIGSTKSYISNIGKRYTSELSTHLEVIFKSKDKKIIKATFELYKDKGFRVIDVFGKICIELNCEIYDLIKCKKFAQTK